jgi:hypothetical protein
LSFERWLADQSSALTTYKTKRQQPDCFLQRQQPAIGIAWQIPAVAVALDPSAVAVMQKNLQPALRFAPDTEQELPLAVP